MSRFLRLILCLGLAGLMLPAPATAQREAVPRQPDQRRAEPRRPEPPRRPVAVRGEVIFIGGYFYDPFFGPYPWWTRPTYRYHYFPPYDYRAEVRVIATPRDTSVYVDGFYAGIVDDFDGMFQKLLLPPGGHSFVLFREGYRTAQYNMYLQPSSTLKLRHTMELLPPGYPSEPPPVMPPVPLPPAGSYRLPRTAPPTAPTRVPYPEASEAAGFGTLDLRVQPRDAEVVIDGQPWVSSEPGRFVIEVADGRHHVEIAKRGFLRYSTDIDVRDGQVTPLNVSLPPDKR